MSNLDDNNKHAEDIENNSDRVVFDSSDIDEAYAELESTDNNDDGDGSSHSARNIVRCIVLGAALIVFIVSATMLIRIFSEYQRGENIYESIQAAVFLTDSTTMAPEGVTQETTMYESYSYAEVETAAQLSNIDMASVRAMNSEAIGWIQIPSIARSYPVAHRGDNSYYLTHTFTGEENSSGCIFMDARNYSDFSDRNTIIYGHNMKNGTMFGMLNRYEDSDFYSSSGNTFYITTDNGTRAYTIFAVCFVPSDSIVYNVEFTGETSFEDFLDYVKANQLYDTGVSVLPTDYVVTLSTCTSDSGTRRVVLGKYVGTIMQSASGVQK